MFQLFLHRPHPSPQSQTGSEELLASWEDGCEKRPLLEPVWAFRRSTDMTCLWPTRMVEDFAPLAGIWGCQWLLLAANTLVHVFCSAQVSWQGTCSQCQLPAAWVMEAHQHMEDPARAAAVLGG
jgi:hypothetical protein